MALSRVAVLVINYNKRKLLQGCFESLKKQSSKDFDVFLVDNSSTDGSVDFVEKNFPKISIINVKKNAGFTGGYNFAFKFLEKYHIKYDIYLLLNNDTLADRGLIEEIVNTFKQSKEIGVVVPTIITKDFLIDSCGGKFIFLTGTPFGHLHGEKYTRKNVQFKCFLGSGSAFAIKRELLKKIGYFEDYFMYFEDVDLSWRVNNSNSIIISTSNTYVIHFGSNKTRGSSSLAEYFCERNRLLSYWQNLSSPVFLLTFPLLLTSRILLLFRYSSLKYIIAKTKGLCAGLLAIVRYKRHKSSFFRDLILIKRMNKIEIY